MATYLALGDSMSIDDYTGVVGGGAVRQFFATLGAGWTLDDRTRDGCRIAGVPLDGHGDVITLTIGGNNLLANADRWVRAGLAEFAAAHAELLERVRATNPTAAFIVGDVYEPAAPLSTLQLERLGEANAIIHANCRRVGAVLARIHDAFRGHEAEYLCLGIEPTLAGAEAIAELFAAARSAGV
jgi:lysophospholipase L1-like esterase